VSGHLGSLTIGGSLEGDGSLNADHGRIFVTSGIDKVVHRKKHRRRRRHARRVDRGFRHDREWCSSAGSVIGGAGEKSGAIGVSGAPGILKSVKDWKRAGRRETGSFPE
jgi:hypothetical protein